MNWEILIVLVSVGLLVPAGLVLAFAVSRDERTYVKHYDARGFSVEACNRNGRRVTNADGIMVTKIGKKHSVLESNE